MSSIPARAYLATILGALAISLNACATVDCDRQAKEAATSGGEQSVADARRECEDRLAEGRRKFKDDEKERDAQERRDEFRHRNEGRRR
jgi:hypothetical protein